MAQGRAWRTEFQNASAVCPLRVRPEASVIVPERMIGRSMPSFSRRSISALIAALAFSVSNTVSIRNMSMNGAMAFACA